MIDTATAGHAHSSARATGLKDLMVSSTGFAFDPRNGLTYTVNPTGGGLDPLAQ